GLAHPTDVRGAADARATWTSSGVDSYTVTMTSSCGERLMIGQFEVTVVDGSVTLVTGLDEPGRRASTVPTLREVVPTITGLLDRLVSADPAHVPEVSFDEATGIPTHVLFDPSPQAVDDEECYDLTHVTPTGS
ncbi:MAG TPA: DUF6174 domain-containing protein, partial [Actinotalea sp.]